MKKRIIVLLWLFVSFAFFISMYYCTNFSYTTPIDDSYIYFQYARNLSMGYFFHYNIEDGFSSGATSFLYPFFIVPAFWLGIDGEAIVLYAFLLNSLFLLYSAFIFHRLLSSVLKCDLSAHIGTAWFLICGPLLWGFYTSMETGLFCLLIIRVLYDIHTLVAADSVSRGSLACYAVSASLLAVCRPEGIAFTFFSTLLLMAVLRKGTERFIFSARNAVLSTPVAVSALFFLTIHYFGGSFSINTQVAKSFFYSEDLTRPWVLMDNVSKGIMTFYDIFKGLFLLSDGKWWTLFFPPLTGFLFLAGLVYAIYTEFSEKKPGVFFVSGIWFFIGMVISTFTATQMLYFNRYQIPLFSIYILGVCFLLSKMSGRVKKPSAFLLVTGSSVLLLALPSTVFFTIMYGYNCKDIRYLQVELGRYIRDHLPENARIAINDAGALRYIGQRYTYDIIGLTSNKLALARRSGELASILEYFETIEAGKRPDYFAVYPEWFDVEKAGLVEKVIKKQYLRTNYSVTSTGKILYKIDWSMAGSGDRPSGKLFETLGYNGKNIEIEDSIDIAEVYSEKAHSFHYRMLEMGDYSRDVVGILPSFGKDLFDGGRSFNNFQEFTLKTVPGSDYWFIARLTGEGSNELTVFIDNEPVGKFQTTLALDRFKEVAIPVDKRFIQSPDSRFTVLYSSGEDSYKELTSFHYWLVRKD